MIHRAPRRFISASLLSVLVLLIVAALHAQSPDGPGAGGGQRFLPNGMLFPNDNGTSSTISTAGRIDLTGPFFQSLGTNGRSCATCHQPSDGMSVSAAHIEDRFHQTKGQDPIFRTVDGSNCDTADVSTVDARRSAYSLLRTRGLFRIAIDVPANADYLITGVNNPYGCGSTSSISMYRRPLPGANLPFLSAVMWDGRESAGARKIGFGNYPNQLIANLLVQSLDATNGHAQGAGVRPTDAEKSQIVDFEMSVFTAQANDRGAGRLDAQGATGGPMPLLTQPFFISINSSVDFVQGLFTAPLTELPGGPFDPKIFNMFDAWSSLPARDPRAAIARGQALFNSRQFVISDVAGINDDTTAGGLIPGGLPQAVGTCGTCHDTPNVGNHSFPTPLDIGTGDPSPADPSRNLGGLDIRYLPSITVCKMNDPVNDRTPSNHCVTTTDLGQALVDGRFDHVGKIKGPILRSLSARAPFFHNGSAQTLGDVVDFYDRRFTIGLSAQEKSDLAAFLGAL